MRPEILAKQEGWIVETHDAGTCYVPADIAPVPDWLSRGVQVDADTGPFSLLESCIADYVEGVHIESIEALAKPHYFARLSAPGYLDCTEWCAFETLKAVREYLRAQRASS